MSGKTEKIWNLPSDKQKVVLQVAQLGTIIVTVFLAGMWASDMRSNLRESHQALLGQGRELKAIRVEQQAMRKEWSEFRLTVIADLSTRIRLLERDIEVLNKRISDKH